MSVVLWLSIDVGTQHLDMLCVVELLIACDDTTKACI